MKEVFKRLKASNPNLFKALNDYFKRELENTFIKMLACEETSRLHFLRGIGSAYLRILNDMVEIKEENTKVKI